MEERASQLLKKINDRTARLGIIGMGYVGLPLAVEFGKAGFKVIGVDINEERTRQLQSGQSYIPDVPSEEIRYLVSTGRFEATSDPNRLMDVDTVTICVPTPLRKTRDPDLSHIMAAMEWICDDAPAGRLIILESTTYPGTTQEVLLPLLEGSDRRVGKDFFLAFSPERVDPGNKQFTTSNTPKIVGGMTPACTQLAKALYETAIQKVVPVSSTKVAETVKLLENTFRIVNIGLVNEIALICHNLGIDVWEVIDAAGTKPFGFLAFYPGPGIGGHCIPIDPFYLSWKARQSGLDSKFIELAGQINSRMPQYVVEKIAEALNDRKKCLNGSKMLVVGVSYKKDINDIRESPALDIISLLIGKGVRIQYHDPYVPEFKLRESEIRSVELTTDLMREQDCVLITTNHSSLDYESIVKASSLVMDTRNALKGYNSPNIIRI